MKRSLLAAVFLASLALAKTFTLEQVLSAPFPSELIAASGGGKVAWLLNEGGARNIWVAAAPDFKGVRLTNYTRDDGQDMGQLRWTPDANALVYVRGGDLEFLGPPDPNPTPDPTGVDQSIWIAAAGPQAPTPSSTCAAAAWNSSAAPTPTPPRTPPASINPFGSPPPVKRRAKSLRDLRRWYRRRATRWLTCWADRSGWRRSPAPVDPRC